MVICEHKYIINKTKGTIISENNFNTINQGLTIPYIIGR